MGGTNPPSGGVSPRPAVRPNQRATAVLDLLAACIFVFKYWPRRGQARPPSLLSSTRLARKRRLLGTKLHFISPTAEKRHVLCVGVGGDQTLAARPKGAGYARHLPTRLGGHAKPLLEGCFHGDGRPDALTAATGSVGWQADPCRSESIFTWLGLNPLDRQKILQQRPAGGAWDSRPRPIPQASEGGSSCKTQEGF
jgi:hypothetical protein